MSTYSRVRASGFGNGRPYQPSTTCGPLTPRPRIIRPPVRWSRVSVCIAADVGVRPESWTMAVPSRTLRGPAAPPGQGRERVRAPCLGREDRVEARPPRRRRRARRHPPGVGRPSTPAAVRASSVSLVSAIEHVLVSSHGANIASTGHGRLRLHQIDGSGPRSLPHRTARRRPRRRPHLRREGDGAAAGVRPGHAPAARGLRRGLPHRDGHVVVVGARAGRRPAARPSVRVRPGHPRRRRHPAAARAGRRLARRGRDRDAGPGALGRRSGPA